MWAPCYESRRQDNAKKSFRDELDSSNKERDYTEYGRMAFAPRVVGRTRLLGRYLKFFYSKYLLETWIILK